MDACVLLHAPKPGHAWPPLSCSTEVSFVVPLKAFLSDLDCERIRHQLELDVPRSKVVVHGAPTVDPKVVFQSTPHPVLCTQTVLAPFVEWAVSSGYLLTEPRPQTQLCIFVDREFVHVQKKLDKRVGTTLIASVELHVLADVREGKVVLRWTEGGVASS